MKRAVSFSLILILTVFATSSVCRADVSRSGVLFLRIAAGARAAGMGEAFVAIADDATATHWNPAGLGVYPLTSTWLEYPLPLKFEPKSIALLRNDVPELSYKRYDVWAISDLDLFRLHRSKWLDYEKYSPSTGESLESILTKYSQVRDEARIKRMSKITAEFNSPVSRDSLIALRDRTLSQSGQPEGELSSSWEELLSAWDKCLFEPEDLSGLVDRMNGFFDDDSITTDETNQISSLLPEVTLKRLPEAIKIPYRVLFTDTLTVIGSDGKLLWIGSKDGLFSFDRKRWERYTTEEGLPSNLITAILPVSKRLVWVGTNRGIVKFDGAKWTEVPLGDEAGDPQVVAFANRGEREVWAATRTKLFKFGGQSWQPHENYTVRIGDSLEKVVRRFVGSENEKRILQALEKVKAYNALTDTVVAPGDTLKLPFELGLNGQVTALALDDRQNLWVGTDRGLKRYTENTWHTYGYRVYTAAEGDDVKKAARRFLKTEDEDKISRLSSIITEYNNLGPDGKLEAGEKIYVYFNATGSKILSVADAGGGKLIVGTQYGTVRWDGESWGRYYHGGLEKAKTKRIIHRDGELWFATSEKVVIYAHAKREITFMHANWLPELASDLYYEYFAYVQHMEGWGTVGANVTFLSLGKNIRTDEFGQEQGEFDSFELAFAFSYGTRLNPDLSAGLSAKVIYSHLADQGQGAEKGKGSGSSFALDAGILYDTFVKRLTLGAALTNLGPNIAYIDLNQSDPLPRNLAVGLAYRIVDTPFNRLTATFEVNKELVGLDDPISTEMDEAIENMGIEYWYGTYVALRAGYIYDQAGDIKTATFGAGLQYGLFRFDFAYIPSSKDLALGNTMRFSMTGRF
ncbi:MAG: PorV/PorQ family protein [Candidatus Zixiibacteriota bacterium]